MLRPNCSATSAHSGSDQPWPPCSGACRPPVEAGGDRLAFDLVDRLVGEAAVVPLRLLLERDQDVVGEPAGALLELGRRRVEGLTGHCRGKVSCD